MAKLKAKRNELTLSFELTPALLIFRQQAGDANRFLNTQLVALETLRTAAPVRPTDLVLPWTLPAIEAEWIETRNFTLRNTIISVVDGLDQYLRTLSRLGELVPASLNDALNGRWLPSLERRPTIPERLKILSDHYTDVIPQEYVLAVELLTAWRNRFVHRKSKENIAVPTKKLLLASSQFFTKNHGGADITAAISRFERGEPPSLSDLSTLIACSHRFITTIDQHLLFLQNAESYAVSLMKFLIKEDADPASYLERIFQYGGRRSAGRVHAIFLHNGANHDEKRIDHAPVLSRQRLYALLGVGRNAASELFNIPRPKL